ncbi:MULTISPECIES: hypothetical protein [unclassified Nocardia]|uniref:hypothetical protein n=1 Tax=unclassified Nocardia TaxID=2637762 RepID=UPI0033B3F17B
MTGFTSRRIHAEAAEDGFEKGARRCVTTGALELRRRIFPGSLGGSDGIAGTAEFIPVTAITISLNKTRRSAPFAERSADYGWRTEYFGMELPAHSGVRRYFCSPGPVDGVGVITARGVRCPVLFPRRSSDA